MARGAATYKPGQEPGGVPACPPKRLNNSTHCHPSLSMLTATVVVVGVCVDLATIGLAVAVAVGKACTRGWRRWTQGTVPDG